MHFNPEDPQTRRPLMKSGLVEQSPNQITQHVPKPNTLHP